ncbi:RNA chaperone Hfq [Caldicellulosiruptor naganoensis]|uniref:RNA-binding protein Hfq n=1 Tax=Caldicellulosiruptor naganoensis TaxID=29324 RepID=A0ABY7BIH9_9FIRM|nr:RNA chaperone Hfq [Caldicellulosiruptor naganoensis]WAM32635.1 RNA chaperone Hfq [Caldicellulosiruptor naganoensis]
MAKGNLNLQDLFLNQLRKEKVNVTIFLLSGVQIKGIIKGFDNFTLVVETDNNKQLLIYKHAISSVLPSKPINYMAQVQNSQTQNAATQQTNNQNQESK